MTDADVDGAHIRTLLLTFFYRYQLYLMKAAFMWVFLLCIRLRGVNRHTIVMTRHSLKLSRVLSLQMRHITSKGLKGLGEMMPLQLWETTMDPGKMMLKQLVVEDAAEANMVFSSLMGE